MPELKIQHAVGVYDKTKFSMMVPPVESLLPQLCNGQLKHVVLFGIEVRLCDLTACQIKYVSVSNAWYINQ